MGEVGVSCTQGGVTPGAGNTEETQLPGRDGEKQPGLSLLSSPLPPNHPEPSQSPGNAAWRHAAEQGRASKGRGSRPRGQQREDD